MRKDRLPISIYLSSSVAPLGKFYLLDGKREAFVFDSGLIRLLASLVRSLGICMQVWVGLQVGVLDCRDRLVRVTPT